MRILQIIPDLCNRSSALMQLCKVIPDLPFPVRKCLLSLSRLQDLPSKTSFAGKQLNVHLYQPFYTLGSETTLYDLLEFVTEIRSPVISGFISMMARSLPFNNMSDVEKVFDDTVVKELSAAQNIHHPAQFDWSAIMSSDYQHRSSTPLLSGYPIRVDIHNAFFAGLTRAKQIFSTRLFFPSYSRKTLGVVATRNLNLIPKMLPVDIENTTLGLERLYAWTGIMVKGPTECRWSWKFVDLKPRVYYARGPDQYYASRYIQAIFNILVDTFEPCHRFKRFDHNLLRFPREFTAFVYDYSSFTSKLHEIRNFVHALSCLYRGVIIHLVDSKDGIVEQDLGELLEWYNEACNTFPVFDSGPLSWDRVYEECPCRHNCGMLGVPGNITSCTLCHTIHLAVLIGWIMKVIGDDAFGAEMIDDKAGFVENLSNLGDVSFEKTAFWEPTEDQTVDFEAIWHYTKRPISRLDTRVNVGWQAVFPPLPVLLATYDSFHTIPPNQGEVAYLRKVGSMLFAFASQLIGNVHTDDDIEFCDNFIQTILREIRFSERVQKNLAVIFCPTRVNLGAPLDMILSEYDKLVTVADQWTEYTIVPEAVVCKGFTWRMTSSIKLAIDLGYGERYRTERRGTVEMFDKEIREIVSGKFVPLYMIVLDEITPLWLLELVNTEMCRFITDETYGIEDLM